MRHQTAFDRWLPVGYFACAVALVALLLPSALRPPPQQPPSSAQLSPDAPPDDNEVLLTELSRGSSGTAGAGVGGIGGTTGGAPASPIDLRPRRGRCWGNPPRQLESLYSPPCAAAWVGDNGGATWRGVTRDEIRVGFMMALTGNAGMDGPIPEQPSDNESAVVRTYRVLNRYFNENMEFYGRKVRFYYVQSQRDDQNNPTAERSAAKRAIEEYKLFAAMTETSIAATSELARGGVTTFTLAQVDNNYLSARRPYVWSATPDSNAIISLGAEYLCKKLSGRPPEYTNDPTFDYGKPRTFGIISYQEGVGYENNVPLMRRLIKERCNQDVAEAVEYSLFDGDGSQAQISAAIARMRAAGVTTIISLQDFITNTLLTQQADEAQYYPEWYIPGFGGLDWVDFFFQGYSKTQWNHAFGITLYEVPTIPADRECDRAYHTLDPDNNPDGNMCYYQWAHMVQLLGAIQLGGPNVTPESIQRGLFAYGHHAPDPVWRMAGGYGPSDWTYPDYAAEIWFDPLATHANGRPGAYRYINGAQRYRQGEITTARSPLFRDQGMVTAPRR